MPTNQLGHLGNGGSLQRVLFDDGFAAGDTVSPASRLEQTGEIPGRPAMRETQAAVAAVPTAPAPPAPSTPPTALSAPPQPTALYVATNLEAFTVPESAPFARDVVVSARPFRRLDAFLWAWILGKIEQARAARDAGTISREAFAALLDRWSRIHTWAADHLDEGGMRGALAQFSQGLHYLPPRGPTVAEVTRTTPGNSAKDDLVDTRHSHNREIEQPGARSRAQLAHAA